MVSSVKAFKISSDTVLELPSVWSLSRYFGKRVNHLDQAECNKDVLQVVIKKVSYRVCESVVGVCLLGKVGKDCGFISLSGFMIESAITI